MSLINLIGQGLWPSRDILSGVGFARDAQFNKNILLVQPAETDTTLKDMARPSTSAAAKTLTAFGSAQWSSAWGGYGTTGSLYLPGTFGSYVTVSPSISLTGDFTLRARIKPEATSGVYTVMSQWRETAGQEGWELRINNGRAQFMLGSVTNAAPVISGGYMDANAEYDIEVNRQGSLFRLFVNGYLVGIGRNTTAGRSLPGVATLIGQRLSSTGSVGGSDGGWYKGYVDGLQIVLGSAIHGQDFGEPVVTNDGGSGGNYGGNTGGGNTGGGGTVPPSTGQSWKTSGNQMLDANDKPFRITGLNYGDQSYGDLILINLGIRGYKSMTKQLRDLGFNCVRLTISDDMVAATRTTYATNVLNPYADGTENQDLVGKTPMGILETLIDYCNTIGMMVILDHHRTFGANQSNGEAGTMKHGMWFDSTWPETSVIQNWVTVAKRLKTKPNIVGCDLHNEPHSGLYGSGVWNGQHWGQPNLAVTADGGNYTTGGSDKDIARYYETCANAIHGEAPHWLIFCEGIERTFGAWAPSFAPFYGWGSNLSAAKPGRRPLSFNKSNRLVYSAHEYSFSQAGHISGASNFPANMPVIWDEIWGWAIRQQVAPILIGELGARFDGNGRQSAAIELAFVRQLHKYMNGDMNNNGGTVLKPGELGVSWTMWNHSPYSTDTGGILEDDWRTVSTLRYNEYKDHLWKGTPAFPNLNSVTTSATGVTSTPTATATGTGAAADIGDQAFYGFPALTTYTTTIQNQTLTNLRLVNTQNTLVKNCVLDGGDIGIFIENCSNIRIENCVIRNLSSVGIQFSSNGGSSNVIVYSNTIQNCQKGGIVAYQRGNGTALPLSVDHVGLRICRNTIQDTGLQATATGLDHGIHLEVTDPLIQDNTITRSKNGSGISVRSTAKVVGNVISESWGSGVVYIPDHYPASASSLIIEYNKIWASNKGTGAGRYMSAAAGIDLLPVNGTPSDPSGVATTITLRYNWIGEDPNPDIFTDQSLYGRNGQTLNRYGNVLDTIGVQPPTYLGNTGMGTATGVASGAPALNQPPAHVVGTELLCNFGSGLLDEDAARRGRGITLGGSAKVVPAGNRVGGAALVLDGTAGSGAVIDEGNGTNTTWASQDWAVEVLFNKGDAAGPATIIGKGRQEGSTEGTFSLYCDASGNLIALVTPASGSALTLNLGACPVGRDTYAALGRTGNTVYGFLNASRITTATISGDVAAGTGMSLGRDISDSRRMVGKIYSARVTLGNGRGLTGTTTAVPKAFPVRA